MDVELVRLSNDLSRLRAEIIDILSNPLNTASVGERYAHYEESWRRFVNTYESCLQTLHSDDLIDASVNYVEEKRFHMEFINVYLKSKPAKSKSQMSRSSRRESSATLSSCSTKSSRMTVLTQKKEELALAELSVQQVKMQQEISRQISELEQQRELLTAQMIAEKAKASLRIYEDESRDELSDDTIDYGQELNEFDGNKLSFNPFATKSLFTSTPFTAPQEARSPSDIHQISTTNTNVSTAHEVQSTSMSGETAIVNNVIGSQGINLSSDSSKHHVISTLHQPQGARSTFVISSEHSVEPILSGLQTISSTSKTYNQTNVKGMSGPQGAQPYVSFSNQPMNVTMSKSQGSQGTSVTLKQPSTNNVTVTQGSQGTFNLLQPPIVSRGQSTFVSQQPHQQQVLILPNQLQSSTSTNWSQKFPSLPSASSQQSTSNAGVPTAMNASEEIVKALRQVVNSPKVEYMTFDGDPLKFISFMHNFESCLERNNPDYSSKLQLLIQHCTGKAREAIESCVNLPPCEGYNTAKNTLKENFGQAHVIAQAYIRRLENLPTIKTADGPTLLSFARKLEETERTLRGMGTEYVNDIDHMNTLKDLHRKLPMFLRAKWTEIAGKMISSGRRPKFVDFLKFVKDRATLVNNEFGEDMKVATSNKDRNKNNKDSFQVKTNVHKATTLVTGLSNEQTEVCKQDNEHPIKNCVVCSQQHKLWKCEEFKRLTYKKRKDIVRRNRLCMKCLCEGHFIASCKFMFKCRKQGCNGEHHTLLHPTDEVPAGDSPSKVKTSDMKSGATAFIDPNRGMLNKDKVNKEQGVSISAATGAGDIKVCLGIIPVKVKAKGSNKSIKSYALLDSGSEVTLCHEQLKDKLNLRGSKINFTLTGMTGTSNVEGNEVDIVVTSLDGTTSVELSNVKTVKEMPISQSCIATREDLKMWSHLKDIDLEELDNKEVMLLIGVKDRPGLFVPLEFRQHKEGEPIAIRYSLGWSVIGPVGGHKKNNDISVNFVKPESNLIEHSLDNSRNIDEEMNDSANYTINQLNVNEICAETHQDTQQHIDNELLEQQLERLWKTDFADSVVDIRVSPSIDDRKAVEIMERTLTKVDNHYQVALPWRDEQPSLPNNKAMAERRCQLLKRRLLRDEELFEKYKTAMHDYMDKGHAVKVPDDELNVTDRPVWFVPHHPVVHPLKPDKVRIVFDCAAKAGGTSLNKELLQGPDLTNQLTGVLSRFRQESTGVVGDIEGMFMQVYVDPKDCDALRFLWWRHDDLSDELQEYKMIKHLFGASSSPSVANFCLRKTADLDNKDIKPEVVETVKRNMYVDDLMKSTETSDEAITLVTQLRELLSRGGFRLTKWYSNSREVLATIPESERAKSVISLDLEKLPTESALGMKWNTEEDKFVWEVLDKVLELVKKKPATRRGILSVTYSLFDPLGFISPYIMKAKLLLQMLSRKGLGWDDALDEEDKAQWERWIKDLPKLHEIKIERCFKPKGFGEVKETQLHLFSDASRVGYASVAYLRQVDDRNQIHCAFVMGKARLAPLREISIPRLELTAAVISVKLSKVLHEELDLTIDKTFYWTDSTSVLKCINNTTKRFHTFESNRLTIILDGSKASEWRYVNREDNPADDGSKGLKLDNAIKDDRWLHGPRFLWRTESFWPQMIQIPVITDDDVEVRKGMQVYTSSKRENVVDKLIAHFSSWIRLRSAVAWLMRYKQYLMLKSRGMKSDHTDKESQLSAVTQKHLTVQELLGAEKEILRRVQKVSFTDVLDVVISNKCGDDKSTKNALKKVGTSIFRLSPVWDQEERMLRVGGRLVEAPIKEASKHPILLPYKHHVTNLIIEHHHTKVGHLGQESVLSSLREKFWVVKGRSAVRSVIRRCISCQRWKRKPAEQYMANLPRERVMPNKPPFTYVGIDYFGPFEVKQRRSRLKRYGCLFTCLNTRAVHIEIAHSLDTDSLINALRRFISIRGCPEQIRSDRGTNLTKANKDLKEALKEINEDKLYQYCTQRDVQWVFNPPAASHMGGAWERMIRTVRQVLKAVLHEQLVNDEVLQTIMAEVADIINARPLTRNSDSPNDDEPLTPNHLLKLRPCPSLPPGIFGKEDSDSKRAWRQAQYLSNVFWKRWIKQYLPTLLERQKWNTMRDNIRVGDLALLVDENYPRGQWPLALVVDTIKGRDGNVRTVKVRVSSTVATKARRQRTGNTQAARAATVVLTRPITKLCPLELD